MHLNKESGCEGFKTNLVVFVGFVQRLEIPLDQQASLTDDSVRCQQSFPFFFKKKGTGESDMVINPEGGYLV